MKKKLLGFLLTVFLLIFTLVFSVNNVYAQSYIEDGWTTDSKKVIAGQMSSAVLNLPDNVVQYGDGMLVTRFNFNVDLEKFLMNLYSFDGIDDPDELIDKISLSEFGVVFDSTMFIYDKQGNLMKQKKVDDIFILNASTNDKEIYTIEVSVKGFIIYLRDLFYEYLDDPDAFLDKYESKIPKFEFDSQESYEDFLDSLIGLELDDIVDESKVKEMVSVVKYDANLNKVAEHDILFPIVSETLRIFKRNMVGLLSLVSYDAINSSELRLDYLLYGGGVISGLTESVFAATSLILPRILGYETLFIDNTISIFCGNENVIVFDKDLKNYKMVDINTVDHYSEFTTQMQLLKNFPEETFFNTIRGYDGNNYKTRNYDMYMSVAYDKSKNMIGSGVRVTLREATTQEITDGKDILISFPGEFGKISQYKYYVIKMEGLLKKVSPKGKVIFEKTFSDYSYIKNVHVFNDKLIVVGDILKIDQLYAYKVDDYCKDPNSGYTSKDYYTKNCLVVDSNKSDIAFTMSSDILVLDGNGKVVQNLENKGFTLRAIYLKEGVISQNINDIKFSLNDFYDKVDGTLPEGFSGLINNHVVYDGDGNDNENGQLTEEEIKEKINAYSIAFDSCVENIPFRTNLSNFNYLEKEVDGKPFEDDMYNPETGVSEYFIFGTLAIAIAGAGIYFINRKILHKL